MTAVHRALVTGLVLAAAVPAAASGAPRPTVAPQLDTVPAGRAYVLEGSGWGAEAGCERRVRVTRTLGHGITVGTARVASDGSFTFRRRVPRAARDGARIALDVLQFCDGVARTSRRVTIEVGRGRLCPGPIAVDGTAYLLGVYDGLGCASGAGAVGPFIGTGIDPDGFDCAHVDRRIAGHDYACVDLERPGRRVTARHVREV